MQKGDPQRAKSLVWHPQVCDTTPTSTSKATIHWDECMLPVVLIIHYDGRSVTICLHPTPV